MKKFINKFINAIDYLINAIDYHNEFSTEEFVLYSILATTCAILIACGESIILSLF